MKNVRLCTGSGILNSSTTSNPFLKKQQLALALLGDMGQKGQYIENRPFCTFFKCEFESVLYRML